MTQRGKSQIYQYIKYNNNNQPKKLYDLQPEKDNFFEYQPSLDEIKSIVKEFVDKLENHK